MFRDTTRPAVLSSLLLSFLSLSSVPALAQIPPSPWWVGQGDTAEAWFGWSVSAAGDVNCDGVGDLVIGAYRYPDGDNVGRVFVYHGSQGGTPSTSPSWYADGPLPFGLDQSGGPSFGYSVASAGDVNGDGCDDLIVGATYQDVGTPNTDFGAAYLFLGSSAGLASAAAWVAYGEEEFDAFGSSVASAGDVNGDGYGDVIIGAFFRGPDRGAAYLFLGSSAGLQTTYAWRYEGSQNLERLGTSVAGAGDVNGDGYHDVIVGAPLYGTTRDPFSGRALVFQGSPQGLPTTPAFIVTGISDESLGVSVAGGVDVNRDGFSDVIVGSDAGRRGRGPNAPLVGHVRVFPGSLTGLSNKDVYHIYGDGAGATRRGFGHSVGGVRDANGDGFGDLIVGAPFDTSSTEPSLGLAALYLGSASGISMTPAWVLTGDQAGARFGESVAGVGDLDGDQFSEVIVGAFLYDGAFQDGGRAFVYRGFGF